MKKRFIISAIFIIVTAAFLFGILYPVGKNVDGNAANIRIIQGRIDYLSKGIDNLQSHLLSLIIIKWLALETKGEFGTVRQRKALDLSVKEINLMLKRLISDPEKRSAWIQSMRELLPEKDKKVDRK